MLTNTRKHPSVKRSRLSIALATVLVMGGVGAMALTFTPEGFPPKVGPSSLTSVTGFDPPGQSYAVTGEIDVSAGAPVTPAAVGTVLKTVGIVSPLVVKVQLSLDHSVLNSPDVLPAPNPAPMAVAAYD